MLKKLIFFVAGLSLIGCGQESDTNNDTSTTGSTARGESCDTPEEVVCIDDMILDLSYQDSVASTDITNLREGQQWLTTIDATAGGFGNSSSNPWVYIRFTDTGLKKLELSDEDSLESMDWHLAAHRFKLRLNSGTGGPSCVKAAALLEGDYDSLDRVPENLTFYSDTFLYFRLFTHRRQLRTGDSSGLYVGLVGVPGLCCYNGDALYCSAG